MGDHKQQLSFDELTADADMQFDVVQTPRGSVKLGTLNSADILEWIDDNEDKERGKFSGLRLLIKSIIQPDGTRIGEGLDDEGRREAQDAALARLKRRDSTENGKLVHRALVLNGLRARGAMEKALKNVLGEVETSASPSDSPDI